MNRRVRGARRVLRVVEREMDVLKFDKHAAI